MAKADSLDSSVSIFHRDAEMTGQLQHGPFRHRAHGDEQRGARLLADTH